MSTLIIGGNNSSRLNAAKENAAMAVFVKATGIEDIRHLEQLISTGTSVVVENANELTVEAQNAFLKTLEEPPKGVSIILLADNEDQLLETVVSRCFVINLGNLGCLSDLGDLKRVLDWMETRNFREGSQWAETVKDRRTALDLIDKLLKAKPYPFVRQLLRAKKYLQANTNVRLTLENLFLE